MDCIFTRGIDDREGIENIILDMLRNKGYSIEDLPVVRVMEGYDLNMRARTLSSAYELAKLIVDCFRDTDIFNRAMLMVSDNVLFLMFTTHDDVTMPEFLTMAVQGNC